MKKLLQLTAIIALSAATLNGAEKTHQIILLRHGESVMNTQKRTSGWGDTRLSEKGAAAGIQAGELLKKEGITFDAIYASRLSRAIETAWLALQGMDKMWIPVKTDWRLNETNQGAYEGKTREEQVAMSGEEKIKEWEESYDIAPPAFAAGASESPTNDPRYNAVKNEIPETESMKDTVARINGYWNDVLVPTLKSGKTVMVVGHSNALRSLSKSIDNTLEEKTLKQLPIPNTTPVIYTLDADMKPISRKVLEAKAE